MPFTFLFGYSWSSSSGLPPGAEHHWYFGPWYWPGRAISVSAHPLHYAGDPPPYDYDLRLEVTRVWERRTPDENILYCIVRNIGQDPVKEYRVEVGGVKAYSHTP